MTPYYEDEVATIYHGDCREILPYLKADALFCDPPYGNETAYPSFNDTKANLKQLALDTFPLMSTAAPRLAITPGVANIHLWPAPTWTLCWFHPAGNGTGPWGFCTWQPVLVYGGDPYLAQSLGRRPDGLEYKPTKDATGESHPCPKPIGFMRWVLTRITAGKPSSLIDPFMGSGTSLRAAKDCGHKIVGIELEEAYCEVAARRMAQEVLAL